MKISNKKKVLWAIPLLLILAITVAKLLFDVELTMELALHVPIDEQTLIATISGSLSGTIIYALLIGLNLAAAICFYKKVIKGQADT